jgi:arylsulfatase A-like enzyme
VPLSPQVPSLVQIFRDNGFATGAIVSSAAVKSVFGLGQGFEDYDERLETTVLNREQAERHADSTTDAAINWIGNRQEGRFFLWIHYIDPHGPYYPPKEYRELFVGDALYTKGSELPIAEHDFERNAIPHYQNLFGIRDTSYYIAQYDSEIRFTDEQIGRLLRFLEEGGLMANTIIAITADHGETLTERDICFAHSIRTYDEQARIPLILHFPETAVHKRIDRLVRAIDIMPTILEELHLDNPYAVEGQSLMPLITDDGKYTPKLALVYSEYGEKTYDYILGSQKSIRTSEWKLTRNSWDGSEVLYNLKSDPQETINCIDREVAVANRMRTLRDEWESSVPKVESVNQDIPEETIKQLKSLGYLAK